MTTVLWLIAASAVVGSVILVAAVGRWIDRPVEPASPPPIVVQPTSALRMVLVTVVDGGIVLDGIVKHGHALGQRLGRP